MAVDPAECVNKDGCFASDPEALAHAQFTGDLLIERNLKSIVAGAAQAAQEGIDFENATYQRFDIVQLQVNGSGGSTRPIAELVGESDGDLDMRVARCAYACGSAMSQCPFVKQG